MATRQLNSGLPALSAMALAGMPPMASEKLIMASPSCLRLLALLARSAGVVFGKSEGGSGSGSSAAREAGRAARPDSASKDANNVRKNGVQDRWLVMVV